MVRVVAEGSQNGFHRPDFAQCSLDISRRGGLGLLHGREQYLNGGIALGGKCVRGCIVRLGVRVDELFRIGITGVDIPRTRNDEPVSRST